MAEFDAADGAMEGFRIARERPQVIPAWAGLQLAAALLLGLLGVALGGDTLNEFLRLQGEGSRQLEDQQRVLSLMGELLPYFLAVGLLNLVVGAVFSAAVFRAVLRPQEGGPGFLRLGADENRLLVSFFLVSLVCGLAGVVAILLTSLGLSALGIADVGAALLGILITFAVLLFLLTRLSLSWPQTFAERRISVVGGWRLSRRRFWPLFGMLLLAVVIALVVYLLSVLIYFPAGLLLGGGLEGASRPFQPDYSSFSSWFSPAMGAYLLIVMGFGGALLNGLIAAPLAYAYRTLAPPPAA